MIFRCRNSINTLLLHYLLIFIFGESLRVDDLMGLSQAILDRLDERVGTGDEIIRDIRQYHKDLRQVFEEVKNDTKDGEVLYRALRDQYGPQHIKLMFVREVYMKCYNWTLEESTTVKKMLDDTRELWRQIERTAISRPYGIRLP